MYAALRSRSLDARIALYMISRGLKGLLEAPVALHRQVPLQTLSEQHTGLRPSPPLVHRRLLTTSSLYLKVSVWRSDSSER